MKPKPGARYIHSASEPYNEEQELSQERIDAWIDHFGMVKFQSHCSGHARGKDLIQAISEINPKIVFPIHTENPEVYKKSVQNVVEVSEAVTYSL
jgi:ribonuclease J